MIGYPESDFNRGLTTALLADLVCRVRRGMHKSQLCGQRCGGLIMRVPARLQTVLEAVIDHRRGAGGGEAAAAEVHVGLDLELQAAAAQRKGGTAGDVASFELDAEADAARRELLQRREVVDERVSQLRELGGGFGCDAPDRELVGESLPKAGQAVPVPVAVLKGHASPRLQPVAPDSPEQGFPVAARGNDAERRG